MKFLTTAAAATLLMTSVASANEIGSTGITWNVETEAEWNFDDEALSVELTPGLEYATSGIVFSLETDLDVYGNEEVVLDEAFDALMVDLGADYALGAGMSIGAETTWDVEEGEMNCTSVTWSLSF
mgnify:CR=1 FL=1